MAAKSIKHKFVSAQTDGPNTAEVRPSNWNDDHNILLGTRVIAADGAIDATDQMSCLTLNKATALALTITQAGTAGFEAGFMCVLRNEGVGAATITPTTSTINGATTFTLSTGQGALLWSDGTDYKAIHIAQRERLTANRTYYVRTDGSNSNNGLANTAGGAFLTVQKAVDVIIGTLDLAGFNVDIQIADGTYTGPVVASSLQVGAGLITIRGNATTPANVLLQVTATDAHVIRTGNYATLHVRDVKLVNTSGVGTASLLLASKGGVITFANIDCGAGIQQLRAEDGGRLEATGNYTVSGGGATHWTAIVGQIRVQSKTVTLTGTPNFTVAFADALRLGIALLDSNTFSGAATGARYRAIENGVIVVAGAGATYLPGDAAGSVATGGQYN